MRIQNREIVRIPAESVEYFMPKHLLDGQILTGAGVLLAGYSKLTKGYYVSRPLNKGFHVVFSTLRGSGKVLLEDGREFFLKEGDVFFSNAYGQGTIVTKSDDENIWETCWIHILPSSTLFEPPVADCIVFHCDFLDEIRHSLVSIMEEEARRDEQALVIQELSVKLFLSYIERLLDFRQVGMDQQFRAKMHDILALFSTSMSQNWKQAKVAEKVAMSRSQLYRRCKESYHVSPGILMKRMKMENALFLLQYTKASIADIAENLGYTTQASFSYAFSRFFGTPPKNMRRQRLNCFRPNTYMETQQFIIGDAALNQVVPLFRAIWEHTHSPLLVAFKDDWEYTGKRILEMFKRVGLIPFHKELHGISCEELGDAIREVDEHTKEEVLIIAIGNDVLADEVKITCGKLKLPFMIVATTPSSSAYASAFSFWEGKIEESCAPYAVIADTTILGKASKETMQKGCIEILSRLTSGADWLYASALLGKPCLQNAWVYAQSDPWSVLVDKIPFSPEWNGVMFRLLLEAGFATQIEHSSLPVWGAEHYYAVLLSRYFPNTSSVSLSAFAFLVVFIYQGHLLASTSTVDVRVQDFLRRRIITLTMLEDVFQMLGISLPAFTSEDESELYELIARIRKIVPGRTLLDYLEYSSSKQMLKQSIHEGLELARRMR